jgi:hypothetical protein
VDNLAHQLLNHLLASEPAVAGVFAKKTVDQFDHHAVKAGPRLKYHVDEETLKKNLSYDPTLVHDRGSHLNGGAKAVSKLCAGPPLYEKRMYSRGRGSAR